jgi:acyl carrier protein
MLAAGASVEIADASSMGDKTLLAERLMAPEITIWDLPTPLMQNLLPEVLALRARRGGPQGPRNIILSGEKQCARLADRLAEAFPGARLTGLYANATLGVWSTVFSWAPDPARARQPAIAEAIPGFAHLVLNRAGEPAVPPTRGDLYLSRAPSSAGAWRTGLRAEVLGGSRVRWLRGDEHHLVKDGCCIELTRIEAMLCAHEHILAAEVIAVPPAPAAERRVMAFVMARAGQVTAEAARDFLTRCDDVDLVPDHFVAVDELPLTAAGTIDRAALVRHVVASHVSTADARSVEIEQVKQRLKGIWLEILQQDDVDDEDSFFTRGGNSLRATLLITRIEDEFAVELSVQQFFREPSLRAVAQLIASEAKPASASPKGSELKVVPREQYRVQSSDVET